MSIILYAIAVLIGLSLGLLGAGGAILSVPAFVYIGHVPPSLASGYALFVLTFSTGLATLRVWHKGKIHWPAFWWFGIIAMITVFSIRRFLLPIIVRSFDSYVSQTLRLSLTFNSVLMLAFAVLMIFAGISMLRHNPRESDSPAHPMRLSLLGFLVGNVSGFLGVGGGFLITPALVIWGRLDMRTAVGTSLALIFLNSAMGVAGDLSSGMHYDWHLLSIFTILTTIGILVGIFLSHRVQTIHLRKGFGWFVIILAITIMGIELL